LQPRGDHLLQGRDTADALLKFLILIEAWLEVGLVSNLLRADLSDE
jgi:hypothetical protein